MKSLTLQTQLESGIILVLNYLLRLTKKANIGSSYKKNLITEKLGKRQVEHAALNWIKILL